MTPRRDTSARVLLRRGSVYSPGAPFATAVLTVGSEVAWVGDEEAAATYVDTADAVVDLDGRLVTPGFVDAHVHLASTGFALESLDLSGSRSLVEALEALSRYAAERPGGVLQAFGWDETRWPEGRPMTRGEVDRAVGERAAYLSRVDSHSAVVSSELLRADPTIASREGWSADGRVERDAHHAVRAAIHRLQSPGDREHALRRALAAAAARGITSVHELNAPHIAPFSDFAALARIAAEGIVPEVVGYWGELLGGEALTAGDGLPDAGVELHGFAGDLTVDGAIGSRTAALHAVYADADTAGHLYLDREQVADHVEFCTRQGVQAGFHVIGDRALSETVAGLTAAAERVGTDAVVAARHRLEHVEMPTADDLSALARLGVVASVQPAFDAAWGGPGELYETRLGPTRALPMNPFGSMARAGIVLAFGSDSPVTPLDPWGAVRAAAFHHEPSERLTARAAFSAATRGGHRARRDDTGGVLAPGAPASYAVWDVPTPLTVQVPDDRVTAWSTDPRAGVPVLPDLHPDIELPRCVRTVVTGTPVYDDGALAGALHGALHGTLRAEPEEALGGSAGGRGRRR